MVTNLIIEFTTARSILVDSGELFLTRDIRRGGGGGRQNDTDALPPINIKI